jgi:uncharacterized protein
MQVYLIPVEGKTIIYRPLLRLAFVGNRAMADLALHLLAERGKEGAGGSPSSSAGEAEEAVQFLEAVGFLEPDPRSPPPPSRAFHPTTAVLLLTSRCNLRCTYCYARGGEGPVQDLSPALARTVIDEVHRNAQETRQSRFDLTFHGGGEPLEAWDVLREATLYARDKELPCHVTMVSNGVCSPSRLAWLMEHLDSFSLSFDGTRATQDRQRPLASGRGSFEAVIKTIRALDEAKFSYGIRLTATPPFRGRLAEDVRFLCEHTGCPAMQVEPAFNVRRGEHQGPTLEEAEAFADAYLEAFEIASLAGRQLTFSGARPWALTQSFCRAPYTALIANPAGELVACYEVADGDHPLARMSTLGHMDGDGIVLDQAAREAFYDYLDAQRAECEDCFCLWHCAGDCYTRAHAAGGHPGGESPRCHMNRRIMSGMLLWNIMHGDGVWRGGRVHPQAAQLMREF